MAYKVTHKTEESVIVEEVKKKRFVWMVETDWAQDYETGGDTWLFETEEEARKKFKQEVANAKVDYDNEGYIRNETDYYFEVYDEGFWLETHCVVELKQKEVK